MQARVIPAGVAGRGADDHCGGVALLIVTKLVFDMISLANQSDNEKIVLLRRCSCLSFAFKHS